MQQIQKTVEQEKIYSFFTVTVTIRVKVHQQSPYKTINHFVCLKDLFLDVLICLGLSHFRGLLKQLSIFCSVCLICSDGTIPFLALYSLKDCYFTLILMLRKFR